MSLRSLGSVFLLLHALGCQRLLFGSCTADADCDVAAGFHCAPEGFCTRNFGEGGSSGGAVSSSTSGISLASTSQYASGSSGQLSSSAQASSQSSSRPTTSSSRAGPYCAAQTECSVLPAGGCPSSGGCQVRFDCQGQGQSCSGFSNSSTCRAHSCTYGTVCRGEHPQCSVYSSLGRQACEQHGCTFTPGYCGGDHVACESQSPPSCSGHGCSLVFVSCRSTSAHASCDRYNGQETACGDHGCNYNPQGSCTGTPHGCGSDATEAACWEGGCSVDEGCVTPTGYTHTCADDAAHCVFNNCSFVLAQCSGTPHECGADTTNICPPAGCWTTQACTGTADLCSDHRGLDSTACTAHTGCLATPQSCEDACSGRNQASCLSPCQWVFPAP